ncbi:uncharacterized protein LOC114829731, partial [Tachysurus ichikawai]
METFRPFAILADGHPGGLGENRAIDEVWASQQRHLECIQDPPNKIMYRVARSTTINDVDVSYYKCLRGSNSLEEGFHKALSNMIPGLPDKRHYALKCGQELGCSVWWQRTAPRGAAPVFSQSMGDSDPFSLQDIINNRTGPKEEVIQPGLFDVE